MTIKNGDLPATAVSTSESICQMTGTLKAEFAGLTKREYFAAMAMQGCLQSTAMMIISRSKYLIMRLLTLVRF